MSSKLEQDVAILQTGLESLYDVVTNLTETMLQIQMLTSMSLRTEQRLMRLEQRLGRIEQKLDDGFATASQAERWSKMSEMNDLRAEMSVIMSICRNNRLLVVASLGVAVDRDRCRQSAC